MQPSDIIRQLARNAEVFRAQLSGMPKERYRWKPGAEQWCLLEVVCHLYDEEREDFRTRVRHTLEGNEGMPPPIDPPNWVIQRRYLEQHYENKLRDFLQERAHSVEWLKSLENPNWDNAYEHPRFGPLSARLFLTNWLAHDLLHIRQIDRLHYQYLQAHAPVGIDYAGAW